MSLSLYCCSCALPWSLNAPYPLYSSNLLGLRFFCFYLCVECLVEVLLSYVKLLLTHCNDSRWELETNTNSQCKHKAVRIGQVQENEEEGENFLEGSGWEIGKRWRWRGTEVNNVQTILHYTMRSCPTQFNLAYPEHIVNNLPPPLPSPPLVTPSQLNSTQLNSTQLNSTQLNSTKPNFIQ